MTASTPEAVKVAIVGGGCAGLATAWQLAKVGGYDVTVYEKSWRLGGKGASGRDAEGRILEHGLHVWLGFYENAFAMMRECYEVVEAKGWGPHALSAGDRLAHGSIEEAFVPEPRMSVAIPPSGRSPVWTIWSGDLPPSAGLPGTPLDGASNPFTLQRYLERCFELLKTLYLSTVSPADEHESTQVDQMTLSAAIGTPGSPDAVLDWMARRLKSGAVTLAAVLAQAVTILEQLIGQLRSKPRGGGDSLIVLILAVLRQTRKFLADVASLDPVERTRAEIVDIVITIAVGLYKDRILFDDRGFDAVNDLDYTVWLSSHGASKEAQNSRFLMGIYDFAFAYDKGDINQGRLAAGVALRSALRMFLSYRGSPFWRMPSGMGDTVFAPLYRVLHDKGVKFEFMSELKRIDFENANGAISVGALHFSNTAPTGFIGAGLDHLGCWPHKDPRAAASSAARKIDTLRNGENFDVVVLAAGFDDFLAVADISMINDAAKKKSPQLFFSAMGDRWTDMRAYGATVATQSCQIWFDRDLGDLGWRRSPGLLTAFHPPPGTLSQPPFQAIADMTVTLASEELWRTTLNPASKSDGSMSVVYCCGVLAEADIRVLSGSGKRRPKIKSRRVIKAMMKTHVDTLLTKQIDDVWPGFAQTFTGGPSSPELNRYAQANYLGSERYTLSLPGSIARRISPLDRSIENMVIAGDWTANGLDCGCVEAAVMSGMLAAHAITGSSPALSEIVGFDHP